MKHEKLVIKIGGNDLDDDKFLAAFTHELVEIASQGTATPVIVHGGGKEIGELQRAQGLTTRYVDGLRVTDEASLAVAIKVLCGSVNKRLVSAFTLAGLDVQGMSGLDRGLIRAEKLIHAEGDLGWVGTPVSVRGEVLEALLDSGVIPVVAPICLGPDGPYNVNADAVAGAVAAQLGAKLLLITNVPGVLVEGQVIEKLPAARAQALIEAGSIKGGMLPKVRSALSALESGTPSAHILGLSELRNGGGTQLAI